MELPRFQILKVKNNGLLPYALLDSKYDDIVLWADTVKEAKIAKDEYNKLIEQQEYLHSYFEQTGLY